MLQEYLPLQPLGSGATGIVFLAQPLKEQDSLFAIKAFRRSRGHDLHRAHNEEQILSKLLEANNHIPFLPRLHSAFEDGEFRFLVLDYCSGGDLSVLRQSLPDRRFSTSAIRFYAAEIVLALEHLHDQGIVYRDLKPENILLSSDGHIMLTDFDLSVTLPPKKPPTPATSYIAHEGQEAEQEEEEDDRASITCLGCSGGGINQRRKLGPVPSRRRVVPASHSSVDDEQAARGSSSSSSMEARSHSFVGTEEYVAPEVIRGTGHDFAVDWWGLGVLLYEMAHACTPFSGRTSKQTFDNILHQEAKIIYGAASAGLLANLISQLLVKDPSRRLGSRCGAAEIKAHPFFTGLRWDALQGVSRPPFIPPSETTTLAASGFDLSSHLVEVECSRAEARAKRKLHRKQVA